ncbi:hypothetical protein OQA88_7101 [Cercophora sp. LCS_1]
MRNPVVISLISLLFFTKITVQGAAQGTPRKNLIIDTDLFSDVDDASALLLAATSPLVNLLAVNVNHPSLYSSLTASAILAHYGHPTIPIGAIRPLTNATFIDTWLYRLGEYTSKIAYHFSGGSLPWGRADEAWDPVDVYRKTLAESEDVTIVSIGFLDNLSALLNSTGDRWSDLTGRELVSKKVKELVVMGGGYPTGHSYNFWGSNGSLSAHVINTWEGRITFVGDDVGKHVLSGAPLMKDAPETDPVRMAYIYYTYYRAHSSWDPLAVMYAIHGAGGLFRFGNEYGYNHVEQNGSNRWVWDEDARNQHFLRLKVDNETAAAELDRLFLEGALPVVEKRGGTATCEGKESCPREEL